MKKCLILCFFLLPIAFSLKAQHNKLSPDRIVKQKIRKMTTTYSQLSREGKLVRIKAESFSYDQDGNIVERIEFDKAGKRIISTKLSYDDFGNQTHQTLIQHQDNKTLEVSWNNTYENDLIVKMENSNTPMIKLFSYDEEGRLITQKDIDDKGKVFGEKVFEYDAKGNLIKETENLDYLERIFEHTYNKENLKIRTLLTRNNTFENGSTTTQREDYSYDSKGRLGKTVYRNTSGEIESFSSFYYNDQGNLQKEEKGETLFLYQYDKQGNLVQKKKTVRGKVHLIEDKKYEFW